MPFGCMSMARLGAKYAEVGCKSMDTFGCVYAEVGCKSMERLGAKYAVVGCKSMETFHTFRQCQIKVMWSNEVQRQKN